MTEVRTAIAIRIPRPWHTEAEFIHNEVETISRTGILLLGTHSRPQGTILRFEVTLAGGQPLVRGEGRVVSYNAVAFRGEPGLLLRFTRLDPRSKELVDRVAAIRRQEGLASMSPPASLSGAPPATEQNVGSSPGHESSSMSSTGEIGVLSSKLIVAASAFPLPIEPAHDATMAPPPAAPTEAPPPAMATMAAPPLTASSHPPDARATSATSSGPPSVGAPRSRRSVPPPLPAAARRSAPPSARTSAPPPPPLRPSVSPPSSGSTTSLPSSGSTTSLLDASPFEALREQVERRMARRPATPPPPPATTPSTPPASIAPLADLLEPPTTPPPPPTAMETQETQETQAATPATEPSMPPLPPLAATTSARVVAAPSNREDLLRRLRTRASAMPAADRAKILAPRAR